MSTADPAATILLVEDDAPTRTFLADNLTADGYELLVADCARDGLRLLETKFPDVALVDLGLPDGSGLDIVRQVRASDGVASRIDPAVPLVVLSGRAGELDRLRGFERGCDDYLCKPFSYPELRARVEALLRRADVRRRPGRLRVGELEIDAAARVVRLRGAPVELSQKEFALVRTLASDPTRVFTKDELLRTIWGFRTLGSNRRKAPYVGCQPEASRTAVVAAADAAHRSRYRHACVARLSRSGESSSPLFRCGPPTPHCPMRGKEQLRHRWIDPPEDELELLTLGKAVPWQTEAVVCPVRDEDRLDARPRPGSASVRRPPYEHACVLPAGEPELPGRLRDPGELRVVVVVKEDESAGRQTRSPRSPFVDGRLLLMACVDEEHVDLLRTQGRGLDAGRAHELDARPGRRSQQAHVAVTSRLDHGVARDNDARRVR
jgi:DNA-binding response OmpR family regulator